tara:strand:+ start:42 stop:1457 length:1416 start_codon:yes stop_codon:yes gene_type:complete
MSDTNDFNFDINDYTINEQKKVLNISNDYNYYELQISFNEKINSIDKLDISNDNKDKYKQFFKQCFYNLERSLKNKDYGSNFVLENNVKNQVPKVQIKQDRYQILQQPNVIQNNSNFLIQPNVQEQVETFNNPVPTGILNKIRRRTVKHIFSVDTQFRNDKELNTSTDFTYYLPMSINNVISMKLTAAEIPNTWYHIDKFKNIFYIKPITINTMDGLFQGDIELKIEIPIGNYGAAALANKLRLYFDSTAGLRWFYFGIDTTTGKCFIRHKTTNELSIMNEQQNTNITFIPNDLKYHIYIKEEDANECKQEVFFEDTILYTFGFNHSFYNVTNKNILDINDNILVDYTKNNEWGTNYTGVINTERIFGQNKISYLFVSVNDFAGNSKDSIISGFEREHFLSDNILARLQVKFGSFSNIMDNTADNIYKQRDYFGPVKIERLHIKLIDKYGRTINLNNADYSLAFEFQQIYS